MARICVLARFFISKTPLGGWKRRFYFHVGHAPQVATSRTPSRGLETAFFLRFVFQTQMRFGAFFHHAITVALLMIFTAIVVVDVATPSTVTYSPAPLSLCGPTPPGLPLTV